jgi:hypothetical protein
LTPGPTAPVVASAYSIASRAARTTAIRPGGTTTPTLPPTSAAHPRGEGRDGRAEAALVGGDRGGGPRRGAHAAWDPRALVGDTRREPQEVVGDAVAQLQLAVREGFDTRVAQDVRPRREAGLGRALRDIAEDGQRLAPRAPDDHPQLHRREVLRLVDHDVAVGAHLRVDEPARLVEQRDVGRCHLEATGRGLDADEAVDLLVGEQIAGQRVQPLAVLEQLGEQPVRGDARP